jgi:RNA polymerase primary sigma factor
VPASERPEETTVSAYMRSIAHIEVLPPEEIDALAETMEREEAAFRAAMTEIPGTALVLAERWQERRDQGRVTGLLAANCRDGSGRDWSRHIDRTLGTLGPRLEERRALRARKRPPARRLAALDAEIAERVAKAEVALEILLEIHRDFEALLAAPHAESADEKRRLELNTPAARAAMGRARRALDGLDAAKQRFVRHNLRLVVSVAKRYRNMGVPFMDLLQEGNLGLVRAVEKYDRHRGFRFSSYAVWWITQALIRAIQDQSRTVRAPSHVYELRYRRRRAEAELQQRLGRQPTEAEIAEDLDVSPKVLKRAMDAMKPIASLQATTPGTEDRTLEDVLEDPQVADPSDAIEHDQKWDRVARELSELEPRERRVLELRFGFGDEPGLTLQEIGNRMGLSRERVRQIEQRALERLRERDEIRKLVA